ncbi:MAG TPA: sigma-54-dependent Fis family transcriptional regulator, partial [Blastocatellia bacterium]|nr:sigma-54-dependent Fis family transcriptional regulator [Blastocatellia bacterium]
PLRVPPLRERREDIPDLVKHFVKIFSSRSGKKVGISQDAVNALMNRPWEGNVRELEHAIERAVALTPSGAEITGEKCTGENGSAGLPILFPQDGIHLPTHLNEIEKAYVEEALHRADGNR